MGITVKLIAATPEADKVVAAAAKICYSASGAAEIFDGLSQDKIVGFLNKLRTSGHLSPFEHVSFTFAVEGISRVATHQIVRHRMASYSQQSQRYVGMAGNGCIMPHSIENNADARELFVRTCAEAQKCYNDLIALGIPKEDARFILPHGGETRIVITMNARELHHFFALRLCRRAQWEIRELAVKMLREARAAAPLIFETAGPSCVVSGHCTEAMPCGVPYKEMEDLLDSDKRRD